MSEQNQDPTVAGSFQFSLLPEGYQSYNTAQDALSTSFESLLRPGPVVSPRSTNDAISSSISDTPGATESLLSYNSSPSFEENTQQRNETVADFQSPYSHLFSQPIESSSQPSTEFSFATTQFSKDFESPDCESTNTCDQFDTPVQPESTFFKTESEQSLFATNPSEKDDQVIEEEMYVESQTWEQSDEEELFQFDEANETQSDQSSDSLVRSTFESEVSNESSYERNLDCAPVTQDTYAETVEPTFVSDAQVPAAKY
ncbi:MAG: hypothetical protein K2Z81_24600, partial [Cyanobacteria bacterium]|nr:hypothetical protein [Cyanobacteriota bacterium]